MTTDGAPVQGTDLGWPERRTPQARRPGHLPSVGGYLAAGALAVVLFGALSVANVFMTGNGYDSTEAAWSDVQLTLTLTLMFGFAAALLPGIPLAVGAHFWVRRNPAEIVHLAAFAAVGGLTAFLLLAVLGLVESGQVWVLILETAAATAISRFVVGRLHLTRQPEPG